jgi:putative phosphoribosyl transferase
MVPGRKFEIDGEKREVLIDVSEPALQGTLALPREAVGLVLFVHGSGSSRQSPRNQYVASVLQSQGIATLLFDLLTRREEWSERETGALRFNIPLLAKRLLDATTWILRRPDTKGLRLGYFGASTGAAAALVAAAELPVAVSVVVSRGGRPDLAGGALEAVTAPTLLIVGGDDKPVIQMNRDAMAQMKCQKKLEIVPGATHLFEEPGALEEVARLAADWFVRHFAEKEKTFPQQAAS